MPLLFRGDLPNEAASPAKKSRRTSVAAKHVTCTSFCDVMVLPVYLSDASTFIFVLERSFSFPENTQNE